MGSYSQARVIIVVKPKSPYSYANAISMSRSLYNGTYLIVEGNSDVKLFKKFTNNNKCRVKAIPTKSFATQVFKILENRKEAGIVLVLDADFDHLNKVKKFSVNMFYTDNHDIETMIVSSFAFENFLREFTDELELKKLEQKMSKKLREILIENSLLIGYVRWASINNNWKLKFQDLIYKNFIKLKNLTIDYNKFVSELIKNSPGNKESDVKIKNEAHNLQTKVNDPWNVCCGHDITELLLIGLKYIFGYNLAKITRKKIESILRLSYEFRFFQLTQLYHGLKNWEKDNSPYQIFN